MNKRDTKKNRCRKLSSSNTSPDKRISLTSASGMGGIIGGGGYDFQTRYIVCHIPKWIGEIGFTQLFHEGTGDVDIHYGNIKKERREHIQIKNHEIKVNEFKGVIDAFVLIDKGMPGVYHRFRLACPSLAPKVQSLEGALKRLRHATPFYKNKPEALDQTEEDVKKRINDVGLARQEDLILNKVHFEVGLPGLNDDVSSCDVFVANLLKLPPYKDKLLDMVQPAYKNLFHRVSNSRGKILHRAEIEILIASALKNNRESLETAIDLVIHNWTIEKFDGEPEYTLDWSSHFDRFMRVVPDQKVWNEELLPELNQLRNQIASSTSTRLILLRGKCCLSTAISLGAIFPNIGSWVFEVLQPPLNMPWRSDAVPEIDYLLRIEEVVPDFVKLDLNGDSIALIFNITGSSLIDVVQFIEINMLPVKAIILVQPPGSSGSLSITNDTEATSFALASRDTLKQALEKYGVRSTHLFFYGPLALAIFLGQRLTSVGQIHLYEFQDPGYVPSCTLMT